MILPRFGAQIPSVAQSAFSLCSFCIRARNLRGGRAGRFLGFKSNDSGLRITSRAPTDTSPRQMFELVW